MMAQRLSTIFNKSRWISTNPDKSSQISTNLKKSRQTSTDLDKSLPVFDHFTQKKIVIINTQNFFKYNILSYSPVYPSLLKLKYRDIISVSIYQNTICYVLRTLDAT